MKIAVSTWSLWREFMNDRLRAIDFPACVQEKFGLPALEFVEQHLEGMSESYLQPIFRTA